MAKRFFIVLLDKSPSWTKAQADKFADIMINVGTVLFGAMVVPFLVATVDNPPISVLFFGLALVSSAWYLSLRLVETEEVLYDRL